MLVIRSVPSLTHPVGTDISGQADRAVRKGAKPRQGSSLTSIKNPSKKGRES
jgi:hypothetical protein